MEFKITIDQFEGPLDLMLHLIKENKLDLFDLDMLVLANQYIDFIHQMTDMHLEVASEYLIELASLVEYKSRKLLPREEVEVEEEYEEEKRDQLVSRLLEYQQYKEASQFLKEAFDQRLKHFSRPQSSLIDQWSKPIESDQFPPQSPYELMKAMERTLHRKVLLDPYKTQMTIKEISVEDRVEVLKEHFQKNYEALSFEKLCSDCLNLHMIIVTFLALLDLIHQKYINFYIEEETLYFMKGELS